MSKPRGLPIGGQEAELLVAKGSYRIVSRSNDKGTLRVHIEPTNSGSGKGPQGSALREFAARRISSRTAPNRKRWERFGSTGDDLILPEDDK